MEILRSYKQFYTELSQLLVCKDRQYNIITFITVVSNTVSKAYHMLPTLNILNKSVSVLHSVFVKTKLTYTKLINVYKTEVMTVTECQGSAVSDKNDQLNRSNNNQQIYYKCKSGHISSSKCIK